MAANMSLVCFTPSTGVAGSQSRPFVPRALLPTGPVCFLYFPAKLATSTTAATTRALPYRRSSIALNRGQGTGGHCRGCHVRSRFPTTCAEAPLLPEGVSRIARGDQAPVHTLDPRCVYRRTCTSLQHAAICCVRCALGLTSLTVATRAAPSQRLDLGSASAQSAKGRLSSRMRVCCSIGVSVLRWKICTARMPSSSQTCHSSVMLLLTLACKASGAKGPPQNDCARASHAAGDARCCTAAVARARTRQLVALLP
jgi:hypothetical protein